MAVSDQSPGTAVPPLSLMTCLIRVSAAVSLTAVHRTDRPMKTMTPPLRPSAKPGIDVAVGVDLYALPAHRRAGDRDGVGAGPLHVARVTAGLGQGVPRSRGHQRADTGGPGRPGGGAGRRSRAQRPGGGSGRAAAHGLDEGQPGGAGDRVGHHEDVLAGGQRRGVREARGSSALPVARPSSAYRARSRAGRWSPSRRWRPCRPGRDRCVPTPNGWGVPPSVRAAWRSVGWVPSA